MNTENHTHNSLRRMDILLDRVLPRIWWLTLPFYLLTRLSRLLGMGIWLLSNEYIKRQLGECGTGVRIHGPLRLSAPRRVRLGNNVHINANAFIRAEGGLSIGDNTHISRNLTLYTVNHDYQGKRLPYDECLVQKPVQIGRNVWIGMNVNIAPGVTIGDGAIIAMGAVISRDVAPLSIVGGAPQRELKQRDPDHYTDLEERGLYGGMSGYPVTGADLRATPLNGSPPSRDS